MDVSDVNAQQLLQSAPSMRFTLRQLECFLAVAEQGSISGAAAALRASDSSVADALSAMERSLGAKLLYRQRSRGASLTSDGLTILPIARKILADGAELTAAVGKDVSSIVGPVRIGCVSTLASMMLPGLIVEVQNRYPGVQLEYRTGGYDALAAMLAKAELDLLLAFDIDIEPELASIKLAETEAMLVVAHDHPLADRDEVELEEVADEPMVLLDILSSRTHTLELMSTRGVKPRIKHRTVDYELCRALVGRGLGYSLLMRRAVSRDTWDGRRVVYLPIKPRPRTVEVRLAWLPASLPPRVEAVVECAQELEVQIGHAVQASHSTKKP